MPKICLGIFKLPFGLDLDGSLFKQKWSSLPKASQGLHYHLPISFGSSDRALTLFNLIVQACKKDGGAPKQQGILTHVPEDTGSIMHIFTLPSSISVAVSSSPAGVQCASKLCIRIGLLVQIEAELAHQKEQECQEDIFAQPGV